MHPTDPGQGEFARLLAEIQRRSGLTDQRIAEASGVNRSQVWRWVHAGSVPGYEPVRRLAEHLISAHPDLADVATALLPAAGYESPPATPGQEDAPLAAGRPSSSLFDDVPEDELRPYLNAVLAEIGAAIAKHGPKPAGAQMRTLDDEPWNAQEIEIWDNSPFPRGKRAEAVAVLRMITDEALHPGERRAM